MIRFKQQLLFIVGLLILGACYQMYQEKKEALPDFLEEAIETEKYIQSSKYSTAAGASWKVMPDSLDSSGDFTLYYGSPGVVLFYLELFNVTRDSIYLQEAIEGASHLVQILPDTAVGSEEAGLYLGVAGTGFALAEMYAYTEDVRYRAAAMEVVDILVRSSGKTENGIHWGGMTDIAYGSAGIGLYLHYVSDVFQLESADSLAILVAEGLLDLAVTTEEGLRWKYSPDYSRYMPNFSHGTAGVAYFLSQTYQRTGEPRYLEASLEAARLLQSLTSEKGYIPALIPGPEGEDLHYLSWCHGPAGTSRLYYSLYQSTGENSWKDKMVLSANSVMDEGIHEHGHYTPGYWNNVGKCCGATGVAEYFLWMHEVTQDKKYLDYSIEMTRSILLESSYDNGFRKWIHAENNVSREEVAAQTGLMQGSAGIGLWLLRLHASQNNQEYLINIPDHPRIAHREGN